MADVGADTVFVQPGAVQFPGGGVKAPQMPAQTAHRPLPDLHGGEVSIVDQRQELQVAGRGGMPVDLRAQHVHGRNRTIA